MQSLGRQRIRPRSAPSMVQKTRLQKALNINIAALITNIFSHFQRPYFGLDLHKSYFDMLNIGIVGLKNATPFIDAMNELPEFSFKGIYDPCLLIDRNHQTSINVFLSFGDLCDKCDAVIFSIDDNLYQPLVCEAIRHSLSVFVAGVHNYQLKELNELLTLRDEACATVHVGHPLICTALFRQIRQLCQRPLDVQCSVAHAGDQNLVSLARNEISLMLALAHSSIHRTTANVYSSFSSVPDFIRVRLDFDNGTVANIGIDRYGLQSAHTIKCINYNRIVEADMDSGLIVALSGNAPDIQATRTTVGSEHSALAMQLRTFLVCIMGGSELHNSLENEISTNIACMRINEKMRINFNVF